MLHPSLWGEFAQTVKNIAELITVLMALIPIVIKGIREIKELFGSKKDESKKKKKG